MSEATKPPAEELAEMRREVEQLRSALAAVVAHVRSAPWLWLPLCLPYPLLKELRHDETHMRRGDGPTETRLPDWKYLVWRKHPWRRQLSLAGRNMTARQLVGTAKANQWSEEEAARNLELPVEAVREAFQYVHENAELLAFESVAEQMKIEGKGARHAARPLP